VHSQTETRVRNGTTWWTPLMIPAVLLGLVAIDMVSKGRHVVRDGPVDALLGVIVIAALVGGPAFAAGVRYARTSTKTH
jgi:hypothetical protein